MMPEEITCCICGKKARPATPLFQDWCYNCLKLFREAQSPTVFTLGHPANQTYMYEENKSAVQKWEDHLKAHGFVKKWGRWRQKETKT
jgi:NMD protein affecting ribosome stability and mRNA decay